jgi:hypothetical protein
MSGNNRERRPIEIHVESQDDSAYLTGKRSKEEEEKQIRTPNPRRSCRQRWLRRKEEGDSDS